MEAGIELSQATKVAHVQEEGKRTPPLAGGGGVAKFSYKGHGCREGYN